MKNTQFLFFVTFITIVFCTEVIVAQNPVQRRPPRNGPVRQIVGQILLNIAPNSSDNYRVGNPLAEPIFQGDGHATERIGGIVSLFTDRGQEIEPGLKPIAVVYLASFADYKTTIQTVAEKIRHSMGSVEEPLFLNVFLKFYEGAVGIGFDTNQPAGLILQTDGLVFYPIFFTPLNLKSSFGKTFLEQNTEKLPDGRIVLKASVFRWPFGRLFVREYNGWVFVASERRLDSLPADPTELLQNINRSDLFAARLDLGNMPQLPTGAVLAIGEMQGVANAETELDKANTRLSLDYLRQMALQTDIAEYRLFYEKATNEFVFIQQESVKPNTEKAKLMQSRRDTHSPFHAFYHPENAILAGHFVAELSKVQRKEIETILNETIGKTLLTAEERKQFNELLLPKSPPVVKTEKTGSFFGMEECDDFSTMPSLETRIRTEIQSIPQNEWTSQKKLEIMLRWIGVCYYAALVESVRSGSIDNATTYSYERGFIGAYKISDEKRLTLALDTLFHIFETEFPDVYQTRIRHNYRVVDGFTLTAVTFRLKDFLRGSLWASLVSRLLENQETQIVLGLRNDAICFAVGQGDNPERQLIAGIAGMSKPLPICETFFVYSAYELGQAFAKSGDPTRLTGMKMVASQTDPNARAFATAEFSGQTKTVTLRASGLLVPSFWRLREQIDDARHYRHW